MVQTEDQYKFIYRAIEHHVNKIKSWCHMTFKSRDVIDLAVRIHVRVRPNFAV